MVLNTEWSQVEIIDLINDGSGLAFGIIGGRSSGVVVKTILPGGVADRDGRLQSGDHILQIGEVNLRGLGSEQVASVLRQCGVHVRMVVARSVDNTTSADIQAFGSDAPIVPTKILCDPIELEKHLLENGFTGTAVQPVSYNAFIADSQHQISNAVDVVRNPQPIGKIPLTKICPPPPLLTPTLLHNGNLPETETFTIELKKDDLGLGITVAGYVCEQEEISGIFVKSISKGSAADSTGIIQINDRIIEVNEVPLNGYTNHQAVEVLKNSGPLVKIKFERYLRGPKYEQLQQAIKANELRPPSPPSPTASSLPRIPLSLVHMSPMFAIEPDPESRTSIDFDSTIFNEEEEEEEKEIVIDGGKSVHFKLSASDSVYEKWIEKVEKSAQIVIAQMEKNENVGLGISLEGTVDVENGKEVRPHHYIRNILPDGPVGINGVLRSGDELLEVNGFQLLGLNHLEVVSILKKLPKSVCIVCARYPVPIRIIDTSQHPDAFQARKILAGSFQTLLQSIDQTTLVKAKSETSIASSLGSEALSLSKSRSLEFIAGLPMWCEEPTIIELTKGDHGLGFSILDYQDPLNPQETVIVVRSLVPGGVAQVDGRLIPGDRLLSVNDINVAKVTLDMAVQVLKGAPKGLVKISVAKPLNGGGDAFSHTSQGSEDDDHTCFEDFQECIEEFQEDLIAVPIFIEDDRSFNHSPSISQAEDFGQKKFHYHNHVLENNYLNIKKDSSINDPKDSIGDSDIDVSFKSTNENNCLDHCATDIQVILKNQQNRIILKNNMDSSYDKDGYDTCLEESLSDDRIKVPFDDDDDDDLQDIDDVTPTNSKLNLPISKINKENEQTINNNSANKNSKKQVPSSSEPCLSTEYCLNNSQHICLESKLDELKSYDNQNLLCEGDEFFLVQYPTTINPIEEVSKSVSEPNALDQQNNSVVSKRLTYKLREYYNDYENCLDTYKDMTIYEKIISSEMSDSEIFNEIFLPFKSRSAPNVMDRSFVTLTYDPGPEIGRRKSTFSAGFSSNERCETVIKPIEYYAIMKDNNQSDLLHKHWGSTRVVKIYRESHKSLGISIVGGKIDTQPSSSSSSASEKRSSESLTGIFVKNVTPGTPAAKTGLFKTGDRILEVSGIDLREATHQNAVEAIRNAVNPVVFLVQSLIPWVNSKIVNVNSVNEIESASSPNSHSSLEIENAIENTLILSNLKQEKIANKENNNDFNAESSISSKEVKFDTSTTQVINESTRRENLNEDSGSEDDDEVDETELEGRTVSSSGEQIDRASAANVKRTNEEIAADQENEDGFGYTTNKVKKKYGNLGHNILMVQLERGTSGLGLSLAGHRDRSCMAVFVCGLNPTGMACKTGTIQIGDEILEVNGIVLHGRCHLNASAIIKSLSGPVFKVIILRRKAAIDDIAVKPITQFPVSLAEEISEEHFKASYPNVRTVAIKKQTGQSLGIMIIEGKHAEVGQGIFISDIQEGSAAEKAGLEIGEMILAVNKDSLVGSNYDTAANLFKRTEGLVTLIVSKPGKKDQSQSSLTPTPSIPLATTPDGKTLKTPTPSRPTTPVPEPAADPFTCPIISGRESIIEINTNNESLGINFIGGKDTILNDAIILTEIYKNGVAERDARLQEGDHILDVNGVSIRDSTNTTAAQALRQTLPKMKLTIFRPNNVEFSPVDVDLIKKPGKGVGLSITGKKLGKGVYIADIISGTSADLDGRISKGDILISVNGQNVENATSEEAGAILKTATGKVSLKLHRYKSSSTTNQ